MGQKKCKTCDTTKELAAFAKNKNCADGHLTECKECNKIYRQRNAVRRAEVEKQRRRRIGIKEKFIHPSEQDRKAAHIQACIKWQLKNYDVYREQQKLYRDAHKDHRYALIRSWRQQNKHLVNAWSAKRRARLIQATPTWVDYEAIALCYEYAQELTKTTGIQHVVDHYYPLNSKKVCGLHVAENMQVISKQENLDKGNKHPDEFYRN